MPDKKRSGLSPSQQKTPGFNLGMNAGVLRGGRLSRRKLNRCSVPAKVNFAGKREEPRTRGRGAPHDFLKDRSSWVRAETLRIHASAQGTRIASSLSCVEIFSVLYYGKILKFRPKEADWPGRDRFVVSKGHGAVSLYPILADLGFFPLKDLDSVCRDGGYLGSIPDVQVPGIETVNGSLGHGLGVAAGMALGLKRKGRKEKVFVLLGDGELYEGSVWEAVMFASEHRLDNLIVILDRNKAAMLDYCRRIIDLDPLADKFSVFKFDVSVVDGHDVRGVYDALLKMRNSAKPSPKILLADTVKGKGVASLENDALSHIRNVSPEDVRRILNA